MAYRNRVWGIPVEMAQTWAWGLASVVFFSNMSRVVVAQTVTTLAGGGSVGGTTPGHADGTGVAALFNAPTYVACDSAGTVAVVVREWLRGVRRNPSTRLPPPPPPSYTQAEYGGHNFRSIVISTGVVTTIAGLNGVSGTVDGTGTVARFNVPYGVAMDGAGTFVIGVSVSQLTCIATVPVTSSA